MLNRVTRTPHTYLVYTYVNKFRSHPCHMPESLESSRRIRTSGLEVYYERNSVGSRLEGRAIKSAKFVGWHALYEGRIKKNMLTSYLIIWISKFC